MPSMHHLINKQIIETFIRHSNARIEQIETIKEYLNAKQSTSTTVETKYEAAVFLCNVVGVSSVYAATIGDANERFFESIKNSMFRHFQDSINFNKKIIIASNMYLKDDLSPEEKIKLLDRIREELRMHLHNYNEFAFETTDMLTFIDGTSLLPADCFITMEIESLSRSFSMLDNNISKIQHEIERMFKFKVGCPLADITFGQKTIVSLLDEYNKTSARNNGIFNQNDTEEYQTISNKHNQLRNGYINLGLEVQAAIASNSPSAKSQVLVIFRDFAKLSLGLQEVLEEQKKFIIKIASRVSESRSVKASQVTAETRAQDRTKARELEIQKSIEKQKERELKLKREAEIKLELEAKRAIERQKQEREGEIQKAIVRQQQEREHEILQSIKRQNELATQEKSSVKDKKREDYQQRQSIFDISEEFEVKASEQSNLELNASNYKLLEEIFAEGNKDRKFTYNQIEKLAIDCGAKIFYGNGSIRKFRFPAFDMDTSAPACVNYTVHEPHDRDRKAGELFGVYLVQFRKALEKARITPETCKRNPTQNRSLSLKA